MNNLNQYCPNLVSLKLSGKVTSVAFDALNQYPSKIRDLNFDIQNKTSAALDSFTLNAHHFPHLTTFTIRSDADLAERVTSRHPTFESPIICLKSLNIYTVTMAGFQSIPEYFPALSNLTIFKCRHVTNSVVRRLILNLPSLENMQLSGDSFDDNAFDIPLSRPHKMLHRLSLTESAGLGEFFIKWIFNSAPKLLWLDISYVPINVTSSMDFSELANESKFYPEQLFFLDASFFIREPNNFS
ncbi:hypothetical protein DSO57_1039104 [Entomophthora muscae]|uniref:Uncharacterized protein n=1 Tax=Entomophthora muscae TaxID=34485 RepID=A0ACC2TWE7_9FUNG|nr:hypothetical protein DSO57_1039104 [Entomophthora muscae]